MNPLDPNQVEKLQAISTQLRQAREAQGITLEQVAAKTYIPLRLLRALDAGETDLLPEPVFIQGFIRRYGDLVGLDGTALAQTFPLEAAPPPPPEVSEPEPQTKLSGQSVLSKLEKLPRPTVLAGSAGLAIAVLILGAISLLNRPKPTTPNLPAQKPGQVQSQKLGQKPEQKPAALQSAKKATQPATAAKSPTTPRTAAPIEAAVNLTQESWVEVTVDGKRAFEGTLPQGTQKTWTAQKQFTLLAGNAGGVVLTMNRGPAQPLGKVGEVKQVTVTPNSLAEPTRL
ncbi:RodZ domain-containing protein [Trichocoleus desertorum]|uniref:DUF4115 domain-containing protein n=1 Tax=Trichocoleus desertorum GB2-A4 TaxID=2933944 RepID=A0ABV0JD80_9CYAN|nr:helix-turn-helix domain-containing protein [Trichocoleus sp. FACHB-46]